MGIAEYVLAAYAVYWLWQRREKGMEKYRIAKKRYNYKRKTND